MPPRRQRTRRFPGCRLLLLRLLRVALGSSSSVAAINADLVVSIVLDRARQAAIRLVVDELRRRGKGNVPRYLADLLTQAALLLADQSTLRREKFHDLAMTVVRAFVASNALRTLYADTGALAKAEIWNVLDHGKWAADSFREGKKLRGYLTDWAYYLLGETKMFGRVAGTQRTIPRCVFKTAQGKKICGWLVTSDNRPNRKTLERVLRVNGVLQALQLAKLVKEQGGVDLRRLIEALGKARSIADLSKTPGLDLRKWQADIIISFESKLSEIKAEGEALRDLLERNLYYGTKVNWAELERKGRLARRLFRRKEVRSRLDASAMTQVRSLLTILERRPIRRNGGGLGGRAPRPAATGEITAGGGAVAVTVKVEVDPRGAKILAVLRGWRGMYQFRRHGLGGVLASVDAARQPLANLGRRILELRAIMRRYNRGKNLMRIDTIPLHGLQDLRQQFEGVVKDLSQAEAALRKVFPGKVGPKVRFAQSAAIRLISFFNLMDRVARKVSHNQSLQDITKALSLLGSVRDAKFSAPLFDVMEPVLHALQTHKPMGSDVLFSIIAKVRLDSLITTLASKAKNPCTKKEAGTECWTVKVIHALQESIETQGNTVRIDGGKFAKRLARHGDDFRRRHIGGTFFHLTIGFGGLYSKDPPNTMSAGSGKNRWVPLIGEQIGFGWATPTFWHDRLTAKFGIYASGILYRMLLDSSESEAVILSPFAAVDVFDLVELYAGPTLLIYPPIGDTSIGAKFGFSAGLTVPLGAYLEKL